MKTKLNQLFSKSVNQIKQLLQSLDLKFQNLIPNPKIRKVLYITVASLFGFMFFLILLGLILSPFSNRNNPGGFILNKPQIVVPSPISEVNRREDQKKLLELRNKIMDLKFPESILTIPAIESDLTI